MLIGKNKVVSFHYTLNDQDGRTLDTSAGREAFAYLHGAGNIVLGLEEEMEGKKAGDTLHVAKKAQKLRLIHPLDHNYYEACRTKLGWGGRQWSHD